MTHACYISDKDRTRIIEWDDCLIERYPGNNGIVLKYPKEETFRQGVILFIQGEDIGITPAASDEEAITRAGPLMKAYVMMHNSTAQWAWTAGRREAKDEIRQLLNSN